MEFLKELGVNHKHRSAISSVLFGIDKTVSILRWGLLLFGLSMPVVFYLTMSAMPDGTGRPSGVEKMAGAIVETIDAVDLQSAMDKTGIRFELEQAMLYQSVSASLKRCAGKYDPKAYGQMHDFYQRRNSAAFEQVSVVGRDYFAAAESRGIGPSDILRGAQGGFAETTAITRMLYESAQGEDLDEKGCQDLRRRVQGGALHLKPAGLRS